MAKSEGRLAKLLLRFAAPLSGLRRVPVLGGLLSWISRRLVPTDALIWVQIQQGPAKGLWIRVNPRTGQCVQQGLGEAVVQQALQRHLRPGMTFYDLGANIGFFSLIAARLVGPGGHVVCFEADPEIAERLRENLARNNFPHAIVEQKAVWSKAGTVSFERVDSSTSPDRGLGHVSGGMGAPNLISVEATTLDDYTLTHPAPDFLKCDVEGAEAEVFRGANGLLSSKRPRLLIEMHSPENYKTVTQRLQDLNYDCRPLDENHVLAVPQ